MLSKKHRFHGHSSLNYVYRKGLTVRSPFCAMRYVAGKYDTYRVAVVVSKKVAKAAPARNRIRRRVYEAIRLLVDDRLGAKDIVVTIFDDRFLDMKYEELLESIGRQIDQISRNSRQ